jgi:hypothetical protein
MFVADQNFGEFVLNLMDSRVASMSIVGLKDVGEDGFEIANLHPEFFGLYLYYRNGAKDCIATSSERQDLDSYLGTLGKAGAIIPVIDHTAVLTGA